MKNRLGWFVPLAMLFASGCTGASSNSQSNAVVGMGTPVFNVTPTAAALVGERQVLSGVPDSGWLRLAIHQGKDDASPSYKLVFDTNPLTADDYPFESCGLRCVVSKNMIEVLRGSEIDLGEEDGQRGLLVMNPNLAGGTAAWVPLTGMDPPGIQLP